jgi:hypothetical protein
MSELKKEELFIVDLLKKNNQKMKYKAIQKTCENEFEGVRLILKSLKQKGYVTFDGMVPDVSADIELIKNK